MKLWCFAGHSCPPDYKCPDETYCLASAFTEHGSIPQAEFEAVADYIKRERLREALNKAFQWEQRARKVFCSDGLPCSPKTCKCEWCEHPERKEKASP